MQVPNRNAETQDGGTQHGGLQDGGTQGSGRREGWNDKGWKHDDWDDVPDHNDAFGRPPVPPAPPPTPEQLAEFDRHSARMLVRTILVQLAVTVLVPVLAWMVAGRMAGVSALVGAAACTIPNALFALRLLFGIFRPRRTSSITFFLGEFIKLVSTGVLLGLAAKLGQDVLVWPAVFVGLVVALKSHYGLLLFKDS